MQVITQFLKLETLLDDSVDKNIELLIERGGISMTVNLVVRLASLSFFIMITEPNTSSLVFQVQDLHSITPDYFLEVSGAVIHPLSYQQVG